MKIKLVSDLHLEFSDINIKNDQNYDVLILGGDICIAQDLHDFPEQNVRTAAMLEMLSSRQEKAQRFRDFFKRCSFQFPHVVYVMGNHEHYHGDVAESANKIRSMLASNMLSNVHFLDKETVDIDGVRFIASSRAPLFANASNNSGASGTIDSYGTLIMGRQALAKGISLGGEYGAQPTIVYGTVTDLLKRFRPVGWKHFVGYSVFRQEALRRIESASSIGTNA